MATRKEKVNAGLFLLIGVLLVSATIALVGGLNLHRPGDVYAIRISKSVGGLREGSVVRYLGVPVGRVREVDFPKADVEAVNVEIEITKASTPIRTGTFATLASNFLTGETTIELLGGANDQERLEPGSIITWKPTTLMRLEDSLPSVLDELKRVVVDFQELVGSENRARVAKLLDDFDATLLELERRIEPLAKDMGELKTRLAESGERIAVEAGGLRKDVTASVNSGVSELKSASKSIEGVAGKLATVADNLQKGTEGLDQLVAAMKASAARLEDLLGGADVLIADNRDEIRRTLGGLRQSSNELQEMLATLNRDPSALLFADPRPERTREAGASSRGGKR